MGTIAMHTLNRVDVNINIDIRPSVPHCRHPILLVIITIHRMIGLAWIIDTVALN